MSISSFTYACGNNIGQLEAAVAAAILAGKTPVGPPAMLGELMVQPMQVGSASTSLANIQSALDTAATNDAVFVADKAQTVAAVDGAIPVDANGSTVLTKGSAAAMTIVATATNGIRRRIYNGSSFAHVITGTGLFQDGATEAGNTITFTNKKGAFVEVESYGSKWLVCGGNHYTVA